MLVFLKENKFRIKKQNIIAATAKHAVLKAEKIKNTIEKRINRNLYFEVYKKIK